MKIPFQLTVRNMSLSDAAAAEIRDRASKLDLHYDQIVSCHVTVEVPHRHQHKGILYDVRIDLTVPGSELIVKREPDEDLYVAIRDAFDAARRQLTEYSRRQRGVVKNHEVALRARVAKLFADRGYGFLETDDGREIYFHQHSVVNGGFDRLDVGTEVRFSEAEGEQGPQASMVALVGKPRP